MEHIIAWCRLQNSAGQQARIHAQLHMPNDVRLESAGLLDSMS